ncbi:bacterial transcriptional activator domain-containing protein [Pseudoflavonifractor sp. 60]|uniref:AfsR/SARP family transcriptional regulator n=1 Tax=Pseudoflavonifractor sp. 60 TaxID=2304576 RepID=UPI00136F8DB4|nr:bacterial transcriptional activator domain-containing protein [Pseudoflavonifractor sp. 60]
MAVSALYIQTLGEMTIRRGDRTITIPDRSRKLCLLLARLTQARGQPAPYSELTDLLWQGVEQGVGSLNTLKAILHRARTCLDQLGEGTGREALISQDGCYLWNPRLPFTLDTEEFLRLCREGEAAGEEERLALWLEALELYQGDFLPGLSDHPWAASQAQPLRETYFQTADQVLHLLEGRARWEDMARLTETALALDPCREELCRRRLEALLRLDRREEAAQFYEDFHQRLLSQRGVLPSADLRRLYQQARRDWDPRAVSPVTLQEQLSEAPGAGAFRCEYDFFRAICLTVSRMAERTGTPPHVVLISLSGGENSTLARYSLDRAMDNLEAIIGARLRRGDAFTRCSASQFVLLLPQANYEDSRMVSSRITRAFARQYPHSPASLQVSVQPLLPSHD